MASGRILARMHMQETNAMAAAILATPDIPLQHAHTMDGPTQAAGAKQPYRTHVRRMLIRSSTCWPVCEIVSR
jgi:hypothetical protein